jgi:poly(3-hydroxybutyrate) depolymerase
VATVFRSFFSLLGAVIVMGFASPNSDAATAGRNGIKTHVVELAGLPIRLHTYMPPRCTAPQGILITFAGYDRNARDYARAARGLAKASCYMVLAPHLDEQRFPRPLYQRAGVVAGDDDVALAGCVRPLVAELIAWGHAFARTSASIHATVLFGHSAGAQLLSRLMAYCPVPASSVIIANPSSYTAANLGAKVPFGFGMLTGDLGSPAAVAAYLSQPLTIYLGGMDTGVERLDMSRRAMRQGFNRLERGRRVFREAEALSKSLGVTFRWRMIETPKVGHSYLGMLTAPEALEAVLANSHSQIKSKF